jgi:hypothetical protein
MNLIIFNIPNFIIYIHYFNFIFAQAHFLKTQLIVPMYHFPLFTNLIHHSKELFDPYTLHPFNRIPHFSI